MRIVLFQPMFMGVFKKSFKNASLPPKISQFFLARKNRLHLCKSDSEMTPEYLLHSK
jgi:hypothetical protein